MISLRSRFVRFFVIACGSWLLASCGHKQTVAPPTDGSRAPVYQGASAQAVVPGQAVIVLAVSSETFYANHPEISEIATLSLNSTVYRLVKTDDKLIDELWETFSPTEVSEAFPNLEVWSVDGHGEPMDFFDGDGARFGPMNYTSQENLESIRLSETQETTDNHGGGGVRVAIIDTGIDATHPQWLERPSAIIEPLLNFSVLPPNSDVNDIANGYDDDADDNRIDAGYGHGTHVAGIVHLVAPKAILLILKCLNDEGRGTTFGLASAISNAVKHDANIISLSLGLLEDDRLVKRSLNEATDAGIVVVASAGNHHTNRPQWPAAYNNVVGVTWVDRYDVLSQHANFNDYVDLSAPGVDIVSLYPPSSGHLFAACSGGSMATPIAAGAIALRMWAFGEPADVALTEVLAAAVDIDSKNPGYPRQIGRRIDLFSLVVVAGKEDDPIGPITPIGPIGGGH